MTRLARFLTSSALFVLAACSSGNSDKVTITLFQAAPATIELGQSTQLLFAVDPSDAQVTITGVGDVTGKTQAVVTPTATTAYHLTATKGKATADNTVTVTVGPRKAVNLKVTLANDNPAAGEEVPVTVSAIDATGATATGFQGAVHLTSSDPGAVLPADFAFAPAQAATKQVSVTFQTAGAGTLTAVDTTGAAAPAAASFNVKHGVATSCAITQASSTSVAGAAMGILVVMRDGKGNLATNYAGTIRLSSTDVRAILPPDTTFVPATDAGSHAFSAALLTTGAQTLTATDVANPSLHCNAAINVTPAAPKLVLSGPVNANAGDVLSVGVTVKDVFDNAIPNYAGTVHFTSSDPAAVLPADISFTPADAGVKQVTVTLQTVGVETLTAVDTVNAGTRGGTAVTVHPGAAASCVISQAPSTSVAGGSVGMTVTVRDAFGNVTTGYAGTLRLSSTDVRAILPPDTTFVPATDAGSHAFSAALLTTGAQTLTATDVANAALHCDAAINVIPAAAKLVLSVPGDANAGYAVNVGVTVKDLFDNAIPNYVGTVTFTNSDTGAGAVTPAPLTFTGSEGGVGSTSASFVSLGTQTLGASDAGTPVAFGSATIKVHGLVYTAPTAGRVRLVANAAQSNTQVVQLDLVANERLVVSTFFGGGPGSFATGMNLPLDTTRVGADTTLFIPGAALPAGSGVRAAAGRIGAADHVLYTAVSRKRVAGTVFTQVTEVQPGQVFYSVRLKLQQPATPGPVFDGAQPSPLFRASVRDQFGNDFLSQNEIGIGKLEVR